MCRLVPAPRYQWSMNLCELSIGFRMVYPKDEPNRKHIGQDSGVYHWYSCTICHMIGNPHAATSDRACAYGHWPDEMAGRRYRQLNPI